ncbi:hypothetical protein [Sphingobacterium thalpophilum]|uniref:hypothetical protein n=1 Tax=Sphingobacterium thalpophilum TaxID=259 RepID=UPI003C73E10D
MKSLKELINTEEPEWNLVVEWMKTASNTYEILPRNPKRADEEPLGTQINEQVPDFVK